MIFLFIFIVILLLAVIGFTSKVELLRALSLAGIIGVCTFFLTMPLLGGACEAKALPWSFCGDFTGAINIVFTAGIVGLVASVAYVSSVFLRRRG